MLGQHVDESVEVAEKPLADQPEERPDVQLHLLKSKKIDNAKKCFCYLKYLNKKFKLTNNLVLNVFLFFENTNI